MIVNTNVIYFMSAKHLPLSKQRMSFLCNTVAPHITLPHHPPSISHTKTRTRKTPIYSTPPGFPTVTPGCRMTSSSYSIGILGSSGMCALTLTTSKTSADRCASGSGFPLPCKVISSYPSNFQEMKTYIQNHPLQAFPQIRHHVPNIQAF
jgi:hypothetical protein